MNWIFDNDKPIYKQLVEKLELAIITGKYQPDEKLSSVSFPLIYKIPSLYSTVSPGNPIILLTNFDP